MLETWYNLRKQSSEASSSKGRQCEDPEKLLGDHAVVDDDQLVMSPKDLPGHVDWETADMSHDAVCARDTAFIEYFIRWSVTNVSKYRLFTAYLVPGSSFVRTTGEEVEFGWGRYLSPWQTSRFLNVGCIKSTPVDYKAAVLHRDR